MARELSSTRRACEPRALTIAPRRAPDRRRVVVTGVGMVTPLGRNVCQTFERASQGCSGIDYIHRFDTRGMPVQIGGEIADQWIRQPPGVPATRLEKFASRAIRLMWTAAMEAAEQAKLERVQDRYRVGVVLGYHGETAGLVDLARIFRAWDGDGHWDPARLRQGEYDAFTLVRRKVDAGPSLVSRVFDCRGPSIGVASACAAGGQAIGEAYRLIRSGHADAVITGGCEASLTYLALSGFILLKALTERYSTPGTASRPFDRKRSGFVISEGAGALVLEELAHARERGAPIQGEILGYGDSTDAYRITDIHPQAEGAVLAMVRAIEDAGIERDDVEYINAHGTSTVQNDALETLAIKRIFEDRAHSLPISSNKSMLGHTIGAAGAIETILTLEGIRQSLVLPTINYETPDPRCDLDYVPNAARRLVHRVALSNSFGFGGHNASLCIGAYEDS
jgi:3-oxoacyl-[acyl-carrier-protein] synthase II